MKSHYMRNKALHSCIEIAFLSSVNLYDTVRQLSSLWQLCLAFMLLLLLLLLHATCHMSHGAYSSGIVCLIASLRSVLFSCTTRLLTNVQFIYAADSRQTLKDDSLPRPPPPAQLCGTPWNSIFWQLVQFQVEIFALLLLVQTFSQLGREGGNLGSWEGVG